MQEISFFEQYEWEEERDAMMFWARVDGDPLTCRVTASALRRIGDEEGAERTSAEYFMENLEAIHAIAARMIRDGDLDDKGEIVIDDEACQRLA